MQFYAKILEKYVDTLEKPIYNQTQEMRQAKTKNNGGSNVDEPILKNAGN